MTATATSPMPRRPVLALALVGLGAVMVVGITGAWLGAVYRPVSRGVDLHLLDAELSDVVWMSRLHLLGLLALAADAAALAWLAVKAVTAGRFAMGPGVAAVMGALVAVAAAGIGLVTWPLVQWEQLALWAVTVGADMRGFWFAAFDDDVRFVLVRGREVSQAFYRAVAVAHLAAPAVAMAGLATVAAALTRR